MGIFKRFPSWGQLAPVYAVIVLMIYTWTILWFLWKVPSWLFFLNAGEILTAFAYSLATNLAESLLVLCVPVILAFALPQKWFHDVFVARGVSLAIAGLGCLMVLAYAFPQKGEPPAFPLPAWALALAFVAILVFVYLSGRLAVLRRILEFVADRATIFLYVLTPLSIISLLVILVRSVVG